MDENGFLKLAKMLLQELHDVRIEQTAMSILLRRQKYITFEQLQAMKETIHESPQSLKRLDAIRSLEHWDVDTLMQDFKDPVQ